MRLLVSGFFALLVVLLIVPSAGANTITVNTTADNADLGASNCSLRNAVLSADADARAGSCVVGSGEDVIKMPAGNYRLTVEGAGEYNGFTGDIDLISADSLTIEPASPGDEVTIDGLGSDRIFDHATGSGTLTLRNLALVNGSVSGADNNGGALRLGKGLTQFEGVLLSGNRATGNGGGIYVYGQGLLEMVNSTVTGGQAGKSGGGIFTEPDTYAALASVTITGNTADSDADGSGDGGGIAAGGTFGLANSILAGNTDSSPILIDKAPDCSSEAGFLPAYVISTQAIGSGACLAAPGATANQSPVDPQLSALADNDGPTLTMAIAPGSPAIDSAGSVAPNLCPEKDQRGVPRPAGKCDIGAFEYDPNGVPPLALPGLSKPTAATATFDGTKLRVLFKCPGRFKPRCSTTATPLTKKAGGSAMSKLAKATVKPGKTAVLVFTIKPALRDQIEALTFSGKKSLVVRYVVKSKRVGSRKAKRPAKLFQTLGERVKV